MNINSKAGETVSNSSVEALSPTKSTPTTQSSPMNTTFGEVFSAQATLLKGGISNQTLNVAKLLAPNVRHASEFVSKEKALHETISQAVQHFEKNIRQECDQGVDAASLRGRLQNANIAKGLVSSRMDNDDLKLIAQSIPQSLRGYLQSNTQLSSENSLSEKKQLDSEIVGSNKTPGMHGAKKESEQKDILDESSKKNSDHKKADDCPPEDQAKLINAAETTFSLDHYFANSDKSDSNILTLHPQICWALGSKEWHDEIAKNAAVMFCSDNNTAVLHIKSTDLMGDLKIIIQLAGGLANATFISSDTATLEALQNSFDQLRSSMLDAGVELGQVVISSDVNQPTSTHESTNAQLDRLNCLTPNLGLIADDDMLSNKMLSFYA